MLRELSGHNGLVCSQVQEQRCGSRPSIVSCQLVDLVIPEEATHREEVLAAVIERPYAHELILTGWEATWGPHEGFFVRRRVSVKQLEPGFWHLTRSSLPLPNGTSHSWPPATLSEREARSGRD